MTVEQHGPLPGTNFKQGRDGTPITRIVLHTMVGWISQADASFHNPDRIASAHFGVRVDGSLWQWVNTWDTAYHAGDWDVNLGSIGIEHEDGGDYNSPRPDALYSRSAALVAQFCKEYSIPCVRATDKTQPGILDHRQCSATGCPDALDTDRIIREAAAILAPAPTTPTDPSVDVSVLSAPPVPAVDVAHEWAALYASEAPRAGIRPEIALAQAIHETGNFQFTGTARPEWNNPAGLGVTGAPGVGNVFTAKRYGVFAHLQHLLMYFRPAHTSYCDPATTVLWDQRHYAHRGYANDVHQLDGHWAIPGTGYGDAVLALVPQARALLVNT